MTIRLWLDRVRRDVRHAVRSLGATPAFTVVALTVLTLSIGASTAIFSVVDAVVLRGLPFDDSDRLVAVGEPSKNSPFDSMKAAPQNFFDWREQQDVFTGLAAIAYAEISLKREGEAMAENLFARRVTADFFSVLRAAPAIGRPFSADNEIAGRAHVAVISYALWQRRFGGAPDVVGQYLPGQLASFEILGVMPPTFTYPVGAAEPTDVWVPYVANTDERVRGNSFGYYLEVIGRLRDGVSLPQAQSRMDQIRARLAAETPRWFTDRSVRVDPLHEYLTHGVRRWMGMLLGAVSFVLLIACVNLANLMLVRATARTRELGIRAALGASRWDLARILLLESVVLSLAGAALGALVASWGVGILRSAMPPEVPRVAAIAVDSRVLAVTALVAIVTGIAFGLAPVLQFSRHAWAGARNPRERSSTHGMHMRWLRATLVIAEMALAVVLLVGSGLFLASFARVIKVDLGLDHRNVLTVQIRVLEIPRDVPSAAQRNRQLLLNVLDRVRSIPGVEVASLLGGGLPLRGDLRTVDFQIPGRVLPRNSDIDLNQVSPDYFKAIKVPLLRGRGFSDGDTEASPPVVILNEAAANRYFGGENAIGQVVQLAGTRTIVGIVGNIRHDGPEARWRTQAFVPVAQSRVFGATLVLRTAPDAVGILPAVRQAIWTEFPDATLPARIDEQTLDHYFAGLVAQRRFNMLLLTLFGVLGLVIACVGIYGVMAYVVSQRTHEIGIRMALGALPSAILISVLGGALRYVVFGLAIGLAAAWSLAGLVNSFLFQVRPHEPAIYALAFALLTLTGLAAAVLPARRAARVDPLIALRAD
jgi:putative ABC transport system permease protein